MKDTQYLSTFLCINKEGILIFYLHKDNFREIKGFNGMKIPSKIHPQWMIYAVYN